ncbi:hypothetical protein QVD17_29569 [Tagetes erecta]|uniref:Uncharacterized protein n=1 Tax=Tagetes erecta TaxID=13708 RepID=A0AAD8K160_TARER|nr:hypothetical protein QVD17_29569 [Tagetes erecta]
MHMVGHKEREPLEKTNQGFLDHDDGWKREKEKCSGGLLALFRNVKNVSMLAKVKQSGDCGSQTLGQLAKHVLVDHLKLFKAAPNPISPMHQLVSFPLTLSLSWLF